MKVNQFGVSLVCLECLEGVKCEGKPLIGSFNPWRDWVCDCCGYVRRFQDWYSVKN